MYHPPRGLPAVGTETQCCNLTQLTLLINFKHLPVVAAHSRKRRCKCCCGRRPKLHVGHLPTDALTSQLIEPPGAVVTQCIRGALMNGLEAILLALHSKIIWTLMTHCSWWCLFSCLLQVSLLGVLCHPGNDGQERHPPLGRGHTGKADTRVLVCVFVNSASTCHKASAPTSGHLE